MLAAAPIQVRFAAAMPPDLLAPRPGESLLARVANGDLLAVREVIERYGGLVWSAARRFDAQDAEDAVQEIFVDVWKHAGRYDPAIAAEATFISMIARRRLIDRRRRRDRRPVADPAAEMTAQIDDAPDPARSAEAAQAVRALDQLRPEQREVITLSTGGLSHAEIAEQTGLPLGTVKAHARRGLLAIRAALTGKD